jgi:hypothetical protein
MPAITESEQDMGRMVTGVTLETLPNAVHESGLRPGQKFTLIIEDGENSREQALRRIEELSARATARAQADGIVSDEDVEKFLNS